MVYEYLHLGNIRGLRGQNIASSYKTAGQSTMALRKSRGEWRSLALAYSISAICEVGLSHIALIHFLTHLSSRASMLVDIV